ncbi:MAG: hypothetical protein JRF63_13900 [Deltaproteobacteria bacterium]|nr:hypothetical protein [Deltaproteobacteria bacterium]
MALVLALLAIAPESLAKKNKKKQKGAPLGEAVVHVLDPEGAPVGGVEVILDIERPDGAHDRRLGLSGEDGDAYFRDVRGDCVQVRASVRTETADVEGKPRPCGARVEAFVVVPATGAVPAPAGSVENVEYPEPAEVEDDPYAAPEPAAPDPPVEPEKPSEIPPEDQPFELRARLGPDFCAAMFYEPAEQQRNCDDTDAIGFGIELDAGFHFEEWFVTGVMVGYRYFGSRVVPLDAPEDDQSKKGASNHLLLAGFQLRLSWMLSDWVIGVDAIPLGISHQVITLDDDNFSINEFFASLTLGASYRVGKSSWVGVYVEILQLMPWVRSDVFRPATISAGVLFGTRLGPQPEPPAEGGVAAGQDAGDDSDDGALMRRRHGDF